MFAYMPEKNHKQTLVITLILLLCGLVCAAYISFDYDFGFWFTLPSYIIAPLCFLAAAAIAARYMFFSFEYVAYGPNDFPPETFVIARYLWAEKKVYLTAALKDITVIIGKDKLKKYKKTHRISGRIRNCRSNLICPRTCYIIYNDEKFREGRRLRAYAAELSEEAAKRLSALCQGTE